MSLVEKINEDLKASMKAREELRLSTVRMLKAAVKNKEIEKTSPLTDEEVHAVISTMIKQRKDSAQQFASAGRTDLASKEEAEIKILEQYMPEQLSGDEIVKLIKEAIAQSGASSAADMGRVMKLLMPKVKGKADGKFVNEKVKELLA